MTATSRTALVRGAAAVLHFGGFAGLLAAVACYGRRRPVFQILTYHRVNDDGDAFFPAVPTAVFERQMAYIARVYRVLPLDFLVSRMAERRLPRNALAVTFDDGYRDNLTHAAPILARSGIPATIFVATGVIGTAQMAWFDRVAMAFKSTKVKHFDAPWNERISLESQSARLAAMDRTLGHLKRLPDDDRRSTVDRLLDALGATDQSGFKSLMLTWDDVHALTGLGFSIGAHTVSHPILSRVSAQEAWTEILGSRTTLESVCGHAPTAFAYPNGRPDDYTETVRRLVQEAGFTCAVTSRFGLNSYETSPYELRRGRPWEHDLPTFAMKLALYRFLGP